MAPSSLKVTEIFIRVLAIMRMKNEAEIIITARVIKESEKCVPT